MYGWAGQIVRVDLTKGTVKKERLDPEFAKNFLGGRGFNSKILYDEFNPSITDPFSPDNILCIGAGLLNGTLSPCGGRLNVSVARSPLIGVYSDGNAGGNFAPEMKYAGIDTIVITGASPEPVYLLIRDDVVEIKKAGHLWGKDVWETDAQIKKDLGDPMVQILTIGPAGEKRVAFAIPICNLTRAPGAGGTGAVFGAKNLKAVVVRGTKGIKVADPKAFREASEEAHDHIAHHPIFGLWQKYGTTMLLGAVHAGGTMPVRNWQANDMPDWEKLDGPAFVNQYSVKSRGCFGCPFHCSHFYRVEEGPYATYGEGPEFEATDGFGIRAGSTDLACALYVNTMHNRLGLDVVQSSNVICTAMHLWQDGYINEKDTGGLNLEWGNTEAIATLPKQAALREGFGAIFSEGVLEGVRKIAKMKGIPAEKLEYYVVHTKGNTYSSTDLRRHKGGALAFSTSTRGGDHLRGLPTFELYSHWYAKDPVRAAHEMDIPQEIIDQWVKMGLLNISQYEHKGYMVKYYQDQCAAGDAVEICKFSTSWRFGIGPSRMARMASALTGIKYTWQDILRCGERIWTTEYAMQRRYGLGRNSDQPAPRFLAEKAQTGDTLEKDKFEAMLSEYYEIRGYDQQGVPTRAKLEELGLKDIADDLEKRKVAEKLAKAAK